MTFIASPEYSIQSPGNSTITPLAASGSWIGTAEQNPYPGILVRVETDVIGTLYIGFSVDGTNWNEEELLINHSTHEYDFCRIKKGQYFRLRYENGSGAQSFFRLYSYYGSYTPEIPVERSQRGSTGVVVYVQDQVTGVLDIPFLQEISTETLASNTVVNSYTVTLVSAASVSVGDIIELSDDTNGSYFMQAEVFSIAVNTLTIDAPINRVYLTGSTSVVISTREMNVDGSVTPQVFSVNPLSIQSGDIVRAICVITDNSAMDFETFGGLTTLTRGIVLRINNGDGTYRNVYNFKSNGNIENYSYDARYQTNIGGGIRSFTARMTWAGQAKHGVAIRLDGSLGESLEMVIQDDLTGLTSMRWIAQGSELQE